MKNERKAARVFGTRYCQCSPHSRHVPSSSTISAIADQANALACVARLCNQLDNSISKVIFVNLFIEIQPIC